MTAPCAFRSNHWTGKRKNPGKPLPPVLALDRKAQQQVILEALRREGTIPERIGEKGTWEGPVQGAVAVERGPQDSVPAALSRP